MSGNRIPRVAIVTGGTTGLGAATTSIFAERGYQVLATALQDVDDLVPRLGNQGYEVEFLPADLRNAQSASQSIIDRAINLWGQIDLVVNCAARISHKPISEVSENDWDEIFAVNLKAPFFMAQCALPYLAKTEGCIINISSTNAWKVNSKNQLYDSLKAALNHLTKGMALDFRDQGVRVNALMPGAIRTPLINEWLEKFLDRAPTPEDTNFSYVADPERIARGIFALASEDMRWVNGAEIPIDGGFSLG
jgi:NAD(P)-dependent dehydrogenase (short-subunit alcohol dehydrogenase family)